MATRSDPSPTRQSGAHEPGARPPTNRPRVYSIAAHRGFADALVAGLLPRYRDTDAGLARLTLLLPSRRAARIVTEAFVRAVGEDGRGGLLLPRMAVIGDIDLDEALGPLLDPMGARPEDEIAPAVDPTFRWLRLAELYAQVTGVPVGATALRQAHALAQTIDRMEVEGVGLAGLLDDRVAAIVGDQAEHWKRSTRDVARVIAHWQAELAGSGRLDPPARRNALLDRAAARWRAEPPAQPIVAAGVTSAAPAVARLLRVVSQLPEGRVVLPDLDLQLDDEVWQALGVAGRPDVAGDPVFGAGDATTHPQYHLKVLLNRMGINRAEVSAWHRTGPGAAPPARSRAISNLFLPPAASARWVDLPAEQRRLASVRLMACARPDEEAQAIAVLIREALEVPERRVALVTPDRGLAARVVAHLGRWGIEADDSAGIALPQTAAGRLLLLLAELVAQDAAPVPLLALLTHPLVAAGEGRAEWLDHARRLDLGLRGPRPAPGLAPLRARAAERRIGPWWDKVEAMLTPLFALSGDQPEGAPLAAGLAALVAAAEALCGEGLWARADGRALAGFVDDLRAAAADAGTALPPREMASVLRDAMARIAVRPPWGGHPRVAVYGLLEARMARADLVICGGLVEGTWPGGSVPDALLPPAVLRVLGIPGADFRIGLAAHDLAAALGAPEVVLSWAMRDEDGPTIASRFVLRVQAMLGDQLDRHREREAQRLAREIDVGPAAPPYRQPQPLPDAAQRRVAISVTGLDRLRSDPYQFYAATILRLRRLDERDGEPSAAWKGTAVHRVLQRWHGMGEQDGALRAIAMQELDAMSAHPLTRTLWRPRLLKALEWVEAEVARMAADNRVVIASEAEAQMTWRGVRVHGRADRIDRLADGRLAIVDYKTGKPPSAKRVEQGFSLQLGLIGLIAANGGIAKVAGEPERFEYWSLAKRPNAPDPLALGYACEPVMEGRRTSGIPREDMLPETARYLSDAIDRWILGDEPFTARLNPDVGGYNDYDQLMRLDEWFTRVGLAELRA